MCIVSYNNNLLCLWCFETIIDFLDKIKTAYFNLDSILTYIYVNDFMDFFFFF